MKKKLLSLVLAGAMVASTSVSAFAEVKTITSTNGEDIDHKIEVTGNVAKTSDNSVLPGTISVTVPTTANFTVNNEGKLSGSTITVTNTGTENVEVYANKFIDPTSAEGSGITVKRTLDASTATKDKIRLYLSGQEANAYFGSDVERGIYKSETLDQGIDNKDGIKLASLANGEKVNLELKGEGGKGGSDLTAPIQEKFTLQLKIKKSASKNSVSQSNQVESNGDQHIGG